MKAGRELDALVAEKVMGWSDVGEITIGMTVYVAGHRPEGEQTVVPSYSTDIAAAWTVVERMRELGWRMLLENWVSSDDAYAAFFHPQDRYRYGNHIGVTDDTAPVAICRAALRAVGVEVWEDPTTTQP